MRAQEKRNKPPTKAQKRKTMSTYLKNMAGYKHNQLKNKSFDDIQKLFDKAMKRVNTFQDIDTELVEGSEVRAEASKTRAEGSSKRAGEELEQESSKKQKLEEYKESEEFKKCLEIVPDDGDDVTIDATSLSIKSPSIGRIVRIKRLLDDLGVTAAKRMDKDRRKDKDCLEIKNTYVITFMVVEGKVLNDFPRFVGILIAEFAVGGVVNLAFMMKGDMIIKKLDLKPTIDAMMRDFLDHSWWKELSKETSSKCDNCALSRLFGRFCQVAEHQIEIRAFGYREVVMSPPARASRDKYHWGIAFATGLKPKMTKKQVGGKWILVREMTMISKDGEISKFLGYHSSKEEEEPSEQPKPYDMYGFIDHPELQRNEFAPHRLPQREGNLNGWLIKDEDEPLGNGGNNRCTYKGFMACNPKECDGKGVQARGREAAIGMSWTDFKALLVEEFCPCNEMEKLESEF
ncbi:hypothetical protein Tco_1192894 [Tanacetum coccineum]